MHPACTPRKFKSQSQSQSAKRSNPNSNQIIPIFAVHMLDTSASASASKLPIRSDRTGEPVNRPDWRHGCPFRRGRGMLVLLPLLLFLDLHCVPRSCSYFCSWFCSCFCSCSCSCSSLSTRIISRRLLIRIYIRSTYTSILKWEFDNVICLIPELLPMVMAMMILTTCYLPSVIMPAIVAWSPQGKIAQWTTSTCTILRIYGAIWCSIEKDCFRFVLVLFVFPRSRLLYDDFLANLKAVDLRRLRRRQSFMSIWIAVSLNYQYSNQLNRLCQYVMRSLWAANVRSTAMQHKWYLSLFKYLVMRPFVCSGSSPKKKIIIYLSYFNCRMDASIYPFSLRYRERQGPPKPKNSQVANCK